MRKFLHSIYLLLILTLVQTSTKAQTTLVAGDIAFSGYLSSGTNVDSFSFVLLRNIAANTVINFTDNAWLSTNVFRTGEQTTTFTASAALAAGTEILISGTTSPSPLVASATLVGGASAGTCTGTMLALSTSGDQILAYQGTVAAPIFISAIHMNVYQSTPPINDPVSTTAAAWDGTNSNNTNASALPTGLTTGANCIWIGTLNVSASEEDNAKFNCGPDVSTAALARTALNTLANWISEDGPPALVVIPTGCNYIAGLPAPVFTINPPATITICELANTSITVAASNAASYQWQVDNGGGFVNVVNNTTYSGASSATLTINAAPISLNGYIYRCIATNGAGSVNSTSGTLTVTALPVSPSLLAKTPATATVADGTPVSATFNAGSGGTGCADDFRYTIDNGATYLPYTPGSNISTTGLAATSGYVFIEGRRANCTSLCQGLYIVLAQWVVTPLPASPTTLNAGDIAFSGYTSTSTGDDFSFVLLRNIGPGTVINFTNNGWLSTNVFRVGEETVTWTAPAGGLNAGSEIVISGLTATKSGGGVAGTVTGTALNLSTSGDQILAYRGAAATPTFISAIHHNVLSTLFGDAVSTTAAAWDGTANSTNASALPTGLTTGTNAIWIGTQDVPSSEFNNSKFGLCNLPAVAGPIAALRAALNNQANWTKDNSTPPSFTLPTGCNYLAALAPTITVTGTPLSAFTTCSGTPSAEQSFTVSGSALTANIIITAPVGFEISTTSGSGFTASITLTQSGGTVASTPIYVRLAASATGTPSGNITITSSGASQVDVAVNGTVNPLPPTPTITPGGPTTFCTGGSVTLTSSSATGNLWSTAETTQSITVTTAGTYTVTVTSAGCTSAPSAGTTVTVNPLPPTPTITPGGPTTFCAGGSVVLTSSSATGNTWSTGETTQSITVTTAGTYTVTVTSGGCTSAPSAGTTVTVDPLPTTAVAGPDLTACISPGTATMAANTPVIGTGVWSQTAGPATASIISPTNPATNITNLTTAGTYTFRWTISSGSCPPSFDEMNIVVNGNPAPFVLAGGGTFCPSNVTLSGPVDPNYTYIWERSLSGIANTFTAFGGIASTQIVTTSGNYRLRVTNQFGCIASDTTPVSIADYVFNGSLAVGDAQQTGRLNRFAVVSTCAAPKTCPGIFTTTGARLYDSYTITNPRSVPVCATIGLRSDCGTTLFNVAYLGSFDPTAPCTNYLADPGSTFPGTGYMEVTIPANATIVVVVHEVNPGTGCSGYQLTVDVPRDLSVIIATPPTVPCGGGTSTLTAPIANSYLWSPGGATTQSIITPVLLVDTKFYATMGYGNVGCNRLDSVTVTVTGNAPTITCPANITQANDAGICGAVVNYSTTVTGSPAPTVTYAFTGVTTASGAGNGSGSTFNVGTTNVTVTVTNACGSSNCSFTVTVNDAQGPTVTTGTIAGCYPTVAAAQAAALAATSATDNCPGALTEVASTVGTCSAVVTVTTTDVAGNPTAVTYNTRIDNTAPTVTVGTIAGCYPTAAAAEAAALAATTATDNCPGALTEVASTVGTCSAVITVTTTDGCGNSTSITYNTRIDNTVPTVTTGTIAACYSTVALAEAAALAATSATDNCPGVLTEVASTIGTCSAVITITTTDGCGNATAVTYNTRIDNTPPVITCPAAITVCGPAGVPAPNTGSVTATDNCTGTITVIHVGDVSTPNPNAPYVITRTYRATDGCGNFAECTQAITVNPIPVVDPVANQVVCNGVLTAPVNFTTPTSGGTINYNWTNNTPSIGLAASGTGNIAAFTAVNTGNTPVIATVTVTPTITTGPVTFTNVTSISVPSTGTAGIANPYPSTIAVSGLPTTGVSVQSITLTGITHTWGSDIDVLLVGPGGQKFVPISSVGGSAAFDATATITIRDGSPLMPTGTAAIPSGTYGPTASNSTRTWPAPAPAAPYNFSAPAGTSTFASVFNNTTNWNGTWSLYVNDNATGDIGSFAGGWAISIGAGAPVTCTGTPITYTYTVNPTPNAVATPPAQTICNNTAITTIVLSGNVASTTFAWTRDNTANVTGIAASGSGNISGTLNNSTNSPQTVTFTITPTANGCPGTPITATIVVNPTPVVDPVANQIVCNGALTTPVNFTTPITGTTVTYNWTNNTPSIGLATSGTGNIGAFTAVNTGNTPVVATVTVTPSIGGSPGTPVTFNNATPILVPAGQPGTTAGIANPYPSTIAVSGLPTTGVSVQSITLTGITHTWGSDIDVLLVGPGGQKFVPISSVGGSAAFDATATITIRDGSPLMPTGTAAIPSGTYGPTASNSTRTWPAPAPAAPYNFSAPAGTSTFASVFNNTTNWNGTWSLYVNDNATGDIGSIAGGWGITLVPPSSGCTGTPITFTYTVNPTPIATATPSTQTICSEDAIAPIVLTSTVTGTTYAWTRNNTATVTGIAANGTGTPIVGSLTNTTPLPVTVTFTITPTSPQGCVGLPITATVIVNPRPVMTATPAAQTICNGVTITPIVFASATPGTTYTWTRNNTTSTTAPGGIQASGSGPSITGFMINTTFAPITVTFTIIPTAAGCVGLPVTATVTIQPTTTAVATPAFQVSCSGSPITPIVFTSPVVGTVYRWTRDNVATATGIAANGTGNISGTLTTTATTPVTVTFTIIPSINGCDGPAIIATDTVRPIPSVNTPVNQTLCNGAATTAVTFTSPVAGTVFNWTNNTPSIGLAASGTGNIPSFTATNTTNAPVTATITVTPVAAGCPGTSITFTITVNPTAVVNTVANQILCAGQSTAAINFSSPTTGTVTYSWTNNTPSIGLAAAGTGNIPSFVAVNNTPNAVTATITVTPNSAAGCVGTPITFTITVNGFSVAPTAASSTVTANCGPTTTTLSVVGGALGTGATWRWYSGSCGGTLVGTGASITIPVNTTTTYFVRAEGTCNTTTCASITVTINVVPTISIAAAPYTALTPLLKTNLTATVTPNVVGNVIEWFKDNGTTPVATGATLANINVDQVGRYQAKITTAQGCTATSNIVVIKDSVTSQIFVYPNPNNGQFKIRYYIPDDVISVVRKVVIFDSKGALVYNQRLSVQTRWGAMDINIRGVAQGDYFIKLLDVNEKEIVGARIAVLR